MVYRGRSNAFHRYALQVDTYRVFIYRPNEVAGRQRIADNAGTLGLEILH